MVLRVHLIAARQAVLVALVAALIPVGSAWAGPLEDYQQNGQLTQCYSDAELDQARGDIPNDIAQYAPDFLAALDNGSACGGGGDGGDDGSGGAGGGGGGGSGPPVAGAGPASVGGEPVRGTGSRVVTRRPPRPKSVLADAIEPSASKPGVSIARTAAEGDSGPKLLLLILAGLAILTAALAAAARTLGWNLEPLAPVGHAATETAARVSDVLRGGMDWVRETLPRRSG